MGMPDTLEVAKLHLFSSQDEMDKAGLPPVIQRRLVRLRDTYTYWLHWPDTSDKEIARMLMRRHGVGNYAAYQDVRLLKTLLGELNKVSKDWQRYRFGIMIERAYAAAERRGDTRAMVSAAAAYAKYARLDREDPADLGLDKIRPQTFEITDDPTVAGFKRIPDVHGKIVKLLKELSVPGVEDVRFEEAEFDEDAIFGPKDKDKHVTDDGGTEGGGG